MHTTSKIKYAAQSGGYGIIKINDLGEERRLSLIADKSPLRYRSSTICPKRMTPPGQTHRRYAIPGSSLPSESRTAVIFD